MPTRSLLALAVCSLLVLPSSAPGATEAPAIDWNDTSRDVYLDGELEPAAVVLTASAADGAGARLAILSERADRAFVVDVDALEIVELPLSHFEATATGATSPATFEALSTGRATLVRDRRSSHYLATTPDHTLLISPHQGPMGEIELKELYEVAPAWRRRAGAYTPDPQAVATLAAHGDPVDLTVAFGTWCGDSRNHVPKLLRSLDAANNPNLRLELVAIGRGFGEPADVILGQRLTNVPTLIVSRDGEELGRIVETPASATVEADLAAILRRAPETHHGRWSREAEIARGRYVYRDAGDRQTGDEAWELFGTEGGGRLLHCTVTKDETAVAPEGRTETLEIWHRRDADGASEFVELTRSHGGEHSRTRIWIDDGELHAVTRGNVTGIVDQTLEVPAGTGFVLPCVAEAGYDWLHHGRSSPESTAIAFQLDGDRPTAGKLVEVDRRSAGSETVTTGHGSVNALRLDASSNGGNSRWWLDGELGVPVRGTRGGELVTLEELTVAADHEQLALPARRRSGGVTP